MGNDSPVLAIVSPVLAIVSPFLQYGSRFLNWGITAHQIPKTGDTRLYEGTKQT